MKGVFKILLLSMVCIGCNFNKPMQDVKLVNDSVSSKEEVLPKTSVVKNNISLPLENENNEPEIVAKSTTTTKTIINTPLAPESLGKDPFAINTKSEFNPKKERFNNKSSENNAVSDNKPLNSSKSFISNLSDNPFVEETTTTTTTTTVVRKVLKNTKNGLGNEAVVNTPQEQSTITILENSDYNQNLSDEVTSSINTKKLSNNITNKNSYLEKGKDEFIKSTANSVKVISSEKQDFSSFNSTSAQSPKSSNNLSNINSPFVSGRAKNKIEPEQKEAKKSSQKNELIVNKASVSNSIPKTNEKSRNTFANNQPNTVKNTSEKFSTNNANSGKTLDKQKASKVETVNVVDVNKINKNQQLNEINANNLETLKNNPFNIIVKPLHKVSEYKTGENHTLVIELKNAGETINNMYFETLLPKGWRLISLTSNASLNINQKKIIFLTFFIPGDAAKGNTTAILYIKKADNKVIKAADINFNVASNLELEVFNVSAPQQVKAGELISAVYAIKNNGNVVQDINLVSRNTIEGQLTRRIAPDSTIIIKVEQETDKKRYTIGKISTGIEVKSLKSGETVKAYKTVEVLPVKIKQRDPYFRFPMQASLFYNSYTGNNTHFSTMTAEVKGNGFIDLEKNHHLNFILRGPKKLDVNRFGIADQYSLTYSYKDKTKVRLGDHAYQIDRLGFNSRYGMGFRIDQNVEKWTLSAFYSKPRLFSFNKRAVYGAKAVYHIKDSLHAGVSLSKSKGSDNRYSNYNNENEKGQIVTFSLNYKNKGTSIYAESSSSITNQNVDVANYLNISQRYKNFGYRGNFTIAGERYFGSISNSLQFSNNLYYSYKRFNFNIGQTLSKVNQELDPLFNAAEPYFENYYLNTSYRVNNRSRIQVRLDRRLREDKLEPKNYFYKEYGINYDYSYNKNAFSLNLGGRIGKTQNLLLDNLGYTNSYGHNLNIGYRLGNKLSLRSSIYHNYNNRYGISGNSTNYYKYNVGFNYRLNRDVNFGGNYNSGFSPEETYRRRDFINANIVARVNQRHVFEARANYYQNPGVINNKEVLAFAKYTYRFGIPIKKIIQQGGLLGVITAKDESINVSNIKIISSGKAVLSDKNGNFEINNLPLGKNYILVEESMLQDGVITSKRIPYEVNITGSEKANLNIELVKSGGINGKLDIENPESYNLKAYIKVYNDEFTYFTETTKKGNFKLSNIVPGVYKIEVLGFRENNKIFDKNNSFQFTVESGVVHNNNFKLKLKTRKIKFKNKNFKIGQ